MEYRKPYGGWAWFFGSYRIGNTIYTNTDFTEMMEIDLTTKEMYFCDAEVITMQAVMDRYVAEYADQGIYIFQVGAVLRVADVTVYSGAVFPWHVEETLKIIFLAYQDRELIDIMVYDDKQDLFEIFTEEEMEPYIDISAMVSVEPAHTRLGYISDFDLENRTFYFDEAEWLTTVRDGERLMELGIDVDELPYGFYIYNLDEEMELLELSHDAMFFMKARNIDRFVCIDEFAENMYRFYPEQILYWIGYDDGEILSIKERYVP
jgi:hypothetical protein